jgi:hypothetical protein
MAMAPYLLLPNSFISHLWDQWLVFVCPKGIWWHMSSKPWPILSWVGCVKIWISDFKPEPKLTVLMAMAPYLLLPNSFISPPLWDQWLMLVCPKGFWWSISATAWSILSWDVPNFGSMMNSNLSQNSQCSWPWHHICYCPTVSYHTYGTNDWCWGVPRGFDGPSVPQHDQFWVSICHNSILWI